MEIPRDMATKTKTRTKTNIRPIGDKILVERDEAESITDAGIFLPEGAKDTPKSGTIVAVGTGALNTETGERIPLELEIAVKSTSIIYHSLMAV